MAKRSDRKLTPDELKRVRRAHKLVEQEKDEIIKEGRRVLRTHKFLRGIMRDLKAERERQGLSLGDLERLTGIRKPALSRLENEPNANPTVSTLLRIAEALNRDITIRLTKPQEAA